MIGGLPVNLVLKVGRSTDGLVARACTTSGQRAQWALQCKVIQRHLLRTLEALDGGVIA